MSKYQYFSEDELMCPCCGEIKMDLNFMFLISDARRIAGVPFRVNSAFRCSKHNLEVGGSPTSSHLIGHAMDIKITSNKERFAILFALLDVGFKRIGIGENFIHVDDDLGKFDEIIWLYPRKSNK
jgi:zinc D-Ala-D-Ala carboxypeptidase